MDYKVYEPKKYSIIIIQLESGEFEAYVEEMPTIRATGETKAKAWANCV